MTEDQLPEAPASITFSVTTPKGFPALVTYRSTTINELLKNTKTLEEKMDKDGYKPQVKGSYKKPVEYVEGKECPKCSGRLVLKKKKDGSPFHQCENRKWNPFSKQNEGSCDFIDWLDNKFEDDPDWIKEGYEKE